MEKSVEFSYEELSKATNEFSIKIGQGGFGSVYYAELRGEVCATMFYTSIHKISCDSFTIMQLFSLIYMYNQLH